MDYINANVRRTKLYQGKCQKLFSKSRYKHKEIKANSEHLLHVHLFIIKTNVFREQHKKGTWPCRSNIFERLVG